MHCIINIAKLSEIVADRALEIVLNKLEDKKKPIADQEDLQHVEYSVEQLGYDK